MVAAMQLPSARRLWDGQNERTNMDFFSMSVFRLELRWLKLLGKSRHACILVLKEVTENWEFLLTCNMQIAQRN